MGNEPWRPLSVRGVSEAEELYDTLHEGVPPWLWPSLTGWCERQCASQNDAKYVQRRLRLEISERYGTLVQAVFTEIDADDSGELLLDVVDTLLRRLDFESLGQRPEIVTLNEMLTEAGSVWRVGGSATDCRLVRRVDETVANAAREAMSHGRSGELLRKAWTSAYARDHNAGHAYREAVRAVEAAARPVIAPNDSQATLGKMIGDLRQASAKWTVVLGPDGFDSVEAIRQNCELLWKSQLDRHGTDDETVPLDVSIDEAQAAVHLAAMLVHLFSTRAVDRTAP